PRPTSGPRVSIASGAAIALLSLCARPETARAQAGLLVPTSSGRPDAAVLALREMAVDVGIARGHARVNVRQVFENRTAAVQEGSYRFRLPPSAAVSDFAVWDGLVRVPGVILEKRRARAIYRELTTRHIDPGLLQQGEEDDASGAAGAPASSRPSGGAAFSARVSPIPAWATKRVEIQFQQEAPLVSGRGEFRLALRPLEGDAPVAGRLAVRVRLEDARPLPDPAALPLAAQGGDLVFEGTDVRLDRDLVVPFEPQPGAATLRLSAFRNPRGTLPDGLALAPWERPSELPPEKDGFFLLELLPPARPAAESATPPRAPVSLAIVFDTSLSHRWSGLEAAYAQLVRALDSLTPNDRFALVSFDRRAVLLSPLGPATPERRSASLTALRARPLSPGSDVTAALAEAALAAGEGGRILLLSDGPRQAGSPALTAARGHAPLFTSLTGEEVPEAYGTASVQLLTPGSSQTEADLFFRRLIEPIEPKPPAGEARPAFTVTGGDPKLRDVYPVLAQPPSPGSLSGWIGRYAAPLQSLRFELASPLVPSGRASLRGALPEEALEARDLPRRWARARVDHLLRLIEAEGERRAWVEEVIALSKRYRFVTPYTAFLAAPRSLLRPRRIQPGDPVLRVECDPATVAASALLPFGQRLALVRRPGTSLWEGRFMVPAGLPDGRYELRVLLRDAGGATTSEAKHFVIDGRAPVVRPDLPRSARPGEALRIAARADEDVVVLNARIADGPPVPLRWDAASKRSLAVVPVPASLAGAVDVFFEATDAAKNVGFARARLEVRP
ncbi:MAG: VIT domain-containing protein, partial [Betaproteobacteria bacterium]